MIFLTGEEKLAAKLHTSPDLKEMLNRLERLGNPGIALSLRLSPSKLLFLPEPLLKWAETTPAPVAAGKSTKNVAGNKSRMF